MKDLDGRNLVTQSNNLVEARYTLSKNEQLILCAMISFINPEDKEFLTYKTSISQFSELLAIDKKSSMREIDIIVSRLLSRVITLETPNGWEKFQWVSYAKVDKKEDFLLLRFHDHLKPYLLDLKQRFTSFRLGEVVDLKSIYSIRIYQLLRDYHGRNKSDFTYELSDFRAIVLGNGSKKYINSFKNFRVNILEKSRKELDEKSNLSFSFETIRVGRKIGRIKFLITKKIRIKKEPLALPHQTGKNQPQEIQKMLAIGIATKKAISLLEQYGKETIIKALKFTNEEERGNPAGFFIRILENDWKNPAQQKKEEQKAKAEAKRMQEKRKKEREEATEKLASQYVEIALERELSDLTKEEKQKKIEALKDEYPYVANHIKSLYEGAGAGFILKEIPDHEKNKKIFIHSELKKRGLTKENDQETGK